MASGPEHYRMAEEILAEISAEEEEIAAGSGLIDSAYIRYASERAAAIDIAQVHATLAQAAAIALSCPVDDQPPEDAKQWHKVAGAKPSTPAADDVEAEILDDDEVQAAQYHPHGEPDDNPF